jgi:hypothetical protein
MVASPTLASSALASSSPPSWLVDASWSSLASGMAASPASSEPMVPSRPLSPRLLPTRVGMPESFGTAGEPLAQAAATSRTQKPKRNRCALIDRKRGWFDISMR